MEIDRLRQKLAKRKAKERQPQLSSASHLVGIPTPLGVGPTEKYWSLFSIARWTGIV